MKNSIGNLIKKLRISKGLSQEELSELCYCSRESISKFENGSRTPSDSFLIEISVILEFDFITYQTNINKFKNDEHFFVAHQLLKYIDLQDTEKIIQLLNTDVVKNEFNYDEPLIIKQYCHTLILVNVYDEVATAYQQCMSYLEIDQIKTFQPKINQPHQYYSTILNLAVCLNKMDDFQNLLSLCTTMVNYLENIYFNDVIPSTSVDVYYKKFYIICLNNLADTYLSLNKLNVALDICNKGIQKSNELNILIMLPMLLNLKVEILCKLDDYTVAKSTYVQFKSLCEITNKMNYFETYTSKFRTLYPNLFNE